MSLYKKPILSKIKEPSRRVKQRGRVRLYILRRGKTHKKKAKKSKIMISQTRVARKIQIQALIRAMSNWMSHQRRFVRRKNSNSKRLQASRMILIQRKRRRRACRRTVRRRTCLNLMKRT